MNASQFAEFWETQGYRVVETASCFWYNAQPFAFLSIPYHRAVVPERRELIRVLVGGFAIAIRFRDSAEGEGGLFVCSERNYDLADLGVKARNKTRRGLEKCKVERVEFAHLAKAGAALNEETFARQGRDRETVTERQWQRYCEAARRNRDFEAWGAFVNGRLAALLVAALVEDHFSILHQSSATKDLEQRPNNALTFTVCKGKLSQPDVACVSYGLKSLESTPGLDRFKVGMGFKLRPLRERVVFNPILRPFIVLGARRIIPWMARKHPETDLWRKALAVLQQEKAAFDAR